MQLEFSRESGKPEAQCVDNEILASFLREEVASDFGHKLFADWIDQAERGGPSTIGGDAHSLTCSEGLVTLSHEHDRYPSASISVQRFRAAMNAWKNFLQSTALAVQVRL